MANSIPVTKPPFRKLRGYAFDPITSLDLDTAEINQVVYKVPWESNLEPGPDGEYIKVIDRDPASNAIYKPVDLDDANILAADGLAPSESNPQFHQQMVYAVIMNTIANFEKALGRKVMWSPVEKIDKKKGKLYYDYVPQLLVYPHALRDQNAYYSPERKALLFGYYNATPVKESLFLPGGIVYSCLSHDIIAHETTHAILDGVFSRFMEVTHPDLAGFHEGFADIVALLQHFTYPEIVRNQIRKSQGKLEAESLLSKLAVEFGQSTGEYKSLRDAIGKTNKKGVWVSAVPSTGDYEKNLECHDRGALLVSAVFDAFLAIYKNRTADLFRLATGGTGVVPPGDIHPDLVIRLADEASKCASHVLNMCVRALDYCPPVDLNYGDYLRALITADKELVANDEHNYRIAFINAFRKRGIFPRNVPNLSVDTLCYQPLDHDDLTKDFTRQVAEFLRGFKEKVSYSTDRKKIFEDTTEFIRGNEKKGFKGLYFYLFNEKGVARNAKLFEDITGLVFSEQYKDLGIATSKSKGVGPSVEIHSLRLNNRVGPNGNMQNQIILTLCQRARIAVLDNDEDGKDDNDNEVSFEAFRNTKTHKNADKLIFRGGCTLIFDLNELTLKQVIRKPIFTCPAGERKLELNTERLKMQYRSMLGDLVEKIGFAGPGNDPMEPFASIHQSHNAIL
jgi:hypothetical protein